MSYFEDSWSAAKALIANKAPLGRFATLFESNNARIHLLPIAQPALFTDVIPQFTAAADSKIGEKVISSVKTPTKIIEEVVYTFVHDKEIAWLLPAVKPTNRRLVVPLVFIISLNENGLISNVNVYWEQASVLKQIGVLPTSLFCKANNSEITLPAIGVRIADDLFEDNFVHQQETEKFAEDERAQHDEMLRSFKSHGILPGNDMYESQTNVKAAPMPKKTGVGNILSGEPEVYAVRPSTKVHQPSGGVSHNIFSQEPVPLKTSIPIDPRRFQSQLNLFGDGTVEHAHIPRRDPNRSSLADIQDTVPGTPRSAKKMWSGKSSESQFNIAAAAEYERAVPEYHSARRTFGDGNASHFSLTDGSDPRYENAQKINHYRNPNQQTEEDTNARPSSRVLRPPGGGSSIIIG